MDGLNKEEMLPPGFRFHPTDEELITYYLAQKISDASFTCRAIGDVDLNKCEPWDLPGVRTNRATNSGYWKTTGKDKEIFNTVTSELVGMKKTLVFYRGRAPRGEKTNWVMHEYRQYSKTTFRTAKDEWVVCRVFQKSMGGKKYPSTQHRTNSYNLEIGPSMMPSIMQADTCHFPMGRNYVSNADLAELSRVLRGTPQNMISPIQPQLHYPGPFTISGLNLNLGAPVEPVLRGIPPTLNQQMMGTDGSSPMLTNHVLGLETGFSVDMTGGGNNRYHQQQQNDPCVNFESFWSPF
ncbi:hypothetical protein GIB67_029355 [Kingdonia uniflora]|uniref:NAC domain-containing protein n=1 Tax=Kingdonia uniflora TaxID=39325 RepID=A0A7J7M597_9MAGN|nr:hypothetical protein GIB67_029355 [Kingdonia uniflora]